MKNLFALLVGINEYKPPIPKLNGCLKDVEQVDAYLNDVCSKNFNLHILKLINEQATYKAIISGFRDHLSNAGPEDIVWFHFSGHGSEEKTAPEFLALEPNGKDQTLICSDSRDGEAENLADKELAALLNELAKKPGQAPPHIVVSLDCCHSGSGTRDAGEDSAWGTRAAPSSGRSRSLDSYLDGYYKQMPRLEVPTSKHVLLSACKSVQRAGDLSRGGAFTTGLVNALRATSGNISYADLFMRARNSVQQIRDNQTPQFETLENFEPYSRFLDGTPTEDRKLYEVFKKDSDWYVRCGAIHGLPTTLPSPIELDIWSVGPDKKLVGTSTIKGVGAQMSKIDLSTNFAIADFFKKLLPGDENYRASIRQMPFPKAQVFKSADPEVVKAFQNYTFPISGNLAWTDVESNASFSIAVKNGKFELKDLEQQRLAFRLDINESNAANILSDAMEKVVHWRRTIELANSNKASKLKDMFTYELVEIDEEGNEKTHASNEIRIYATSAQLQNRFPAFRPVVKLKNIQQPLYFYLFFIAYDYSIACPGEEIVYRPAEHADTSAVTIPLWKKSLGWGPAQADTQDTCYFKLLVTTEPLDHQQFLQSGLGVHRDILGEPTPNKVFDDWAAVTFAVTICRNDHALSSGSDVALADGNVVLKSHPSVTAEVQTLHVDQNARASDPLMAFNALRHIGAGLVNLNEGARSSFVQEVIELRNIELADGVNLEEQPIEIEIKQGLTEDELLLPVAFDGKYFHIIGDSTGDETQSKVFVRSIPPEVKDPGAEGERGLLQALKMSFFKVTLGHDTVNVLRWVDLQPDKTIVLQKENLGIRIGKSKNILLVLHGLAGDGQSMVRELLDGLPAAFASSYDLILVYDFESLNTPLETTAGMLAKTMTEFNLDKGGKNVTLLAQSIGGLVGRWLIEQLGGKAYIKDCILVGVPNNGTVYGKVDEYRAWAKNILDVAINFVPSIVPFSGILLKFLKGATDLGGTLRQLDPASPFVNKLNSSIDPGVKYTLVGGDATGTDKSLEGVKGIFLQPSSKIADRLFKDKPNDLFAPVTSILCPELWEGRNPAPVVENTIPRHHFNYFHGESGSRDADGIWDILNKVLVKKE